MITPSLALLSKGKSALFVLINLVDTELMGVVILSCL